MNELKGGMNVYEGVLVLIAYNSLSRGSVPSKSKRNAISLFDLGFLGTLIFIVGN